MANTNIRAQVKMTIQAPIDTVWKALTDAAEVKKYFFGTDLYTTWEVGTPVLFKGEWEGKPYEDKGTVLHFAPNEKLSYDYYSGFSGLEDVPENYQTITYEVKATDNGTLLTITQSNVKDEETKAHSETNWQGVLNELKKLVE